MTYDIFHFFDVYGSDVFLFRSVSVTNFYVFGVDFGEVLKMT